MDLKQSSNKRQLSVHQFVIGQKNSDYRGTPGHMWQNFQICRLEAEKEVHSDYRALGADSRRTCAFQSDWITAACGQARGDALTLSSSDF